MEFSIDAEIDGATNMVLQQQQQGHRPFPPVTASAVTGPSELWSCELRRSALPLPTNCAWLNFVLNDGSAPEYLHPYLVRLKDGQLTLCYPPRIVDANFIIQAFVPDLTIGTAVDRSTAKPQRHAVASFDDLSVTVDLPGHVTVPLVRGCPYVTCIFKEAQRPCVSTVHGVQQLLAMSETKHKLVLNNGQTWLIYSSAPIVIHRISAIELMFGHRCHDHDGNNSFEFTGVLRIALLPPVASLTTAMAAEGILDRFRGTYPLQGHADMCSPFQIRYRWECNNSGELLMLCLPIHRRLWSEAQNDNHCSLHEGLVYDSIDGKMQAMNVMNHNQSLVLSTSPVRCGWFSVSNQSDEVTMNSQCRRELQEALRADVSSLFRSPITTDSTYFYGKALARAARLAVVAEEISCADEMNAALDFLRQSITPWMDGSFPANALQYETKWGGLISRNGSRNPDADFGLGIYNDHHYHLGYFCYAGAILAKLDPAWGITYCSHLYAIVADYMTPIHPHHRHRVYGSAISSDSVSPPLIGINSTTAAANDIDRISNANACIWGRSGSRVKCLWNCIRLLRPSRRSTGKRQKKNQQVQSPSPWKLQYPRYRNFDFWVLHSWAGGLTEFADGRNQESTSEAVNAYYAASLLGMAMADKALTEAGQTLAALEMEAAKTLWHLPSPSSLSSRHQPPIYEADLLRSHRILGVLWANKRDTGLWFAPIQRTECRLGIHVLPITPITRFLFSDAQFAKELVEWAMAGAPVTAAVSADLHPWYGFVYALQALYDPSSALRNIRCLTAHDDGNSLSNLLWWIYTLA